jgi:hypothetical protein
MVYEGIGGWEDLEPWISRIEHFPEEVVDRACKQIPPDWLRGDEEALESLLEALMARKARIRRIVEDAAFSGAVRLFPNWKGSR